MNIEKRNRFAGLAVSGALAVACLFAPLATANAGILPAAAGQFVWTELAWANSACRPAVNGGPCTLGSIDGLAGQSIRIVRLGIGGDADSTSGDAGFRLRGGGLDVSWTAGQTADSAAHDLGATPALAGSARGFTYSPVLDLTALDGASLTITWDYHYDFDGRYTAATDLLGNSFDDSNLASSVRPWIQFERLNNTRELPEPMSVAMLGLGMMALAYTRRRRG